MSYIDCMFNIIIHNYIYLIFINIILFLESEFDFEFVRFATMVTLYQSQF